MLGTTVVSTETGSHLVGMEAAPGVPDGFGNPPVRRGYWWNGVNPLHLSSALGGARVQRQKDLVHK